MSVFNEGKYYELLKKIAPDLDESIISTPNLDNQSDLNYVFGEDSCYVILNKLADKRNRYNELEKEIAQKEDKYAINDLHSIIGTGLNKLSRLQIELMYLNQNFKSIDRHLLTKQVLNIEKSTQNEFVEVIRTVAKLCGSYDEDLQFLSDKNFIDLETTTEKMKEVFAGDRVRLAQIECLFDDLKSLYLSVNINLNDEVSKNQNTIDLFANTEESC